jgi:vitamin-K-epoxide reductase (warfarin-sensitive)
MPVGKMLSYFGLVPSGHVLDVPNAALGILYYLWQLLFSSSDDITLKPLTQVITVAAFGSSVFLAYQLTFVIVELCILCWTTHVVNSILLYKMMQARNVVSSSSSSSSSSKVKGL